MSDGARSLPLFFRSRVHASKRPKKSDKPINIVNEESISKIESFEGESVQALSKKCSNSHALPETVPLDKESERSEVRVSQSFLEEGEVAEIFGLNRSVTSPGIHASEGFECTPSEWRNFVARFSLPSNPTNKRTHEGEQTETPPWISKQDYASKLDFQDRSACREKNVLYLYPEEDYNYAFGINGNVCHRMYNWHSYACSVHMKRVSSVEQSIEALDDFSTNSIKHAVLGGHGTGWNLRWGGGPACGRGLLCIGASGGMGASFLKKLSEKMHHHGSIFLDSCSSSTTDEDKKKDGMNLGEWVARTVGKGIRVIGATRSFQEVKVVAFVAWYAQIDGIGSHAPPAEVVHMAAGARCPDWADNPFPNEDGDCQCPEKQSCELADGYSSRHPALLNKAGLKFKCPKSKGETSPKYFLPMCAESWAEASCRCVETENSKRQKV